MNHCGCGKETFYGVSSTCFPTCNGWGKRKAERTHLHTKLCLKWNFKMKWELPVGNVTPDCNNSIKEQSKTKACERELKWWNINILFIDIHYKSQSSLKNSIELFGAFRKIFQSFEGAKFMLFSNIFLMTFKFRI